MNWLRALGRRGFTALEENEVLQAIRQGMILATPLLIAGSCALLLYSLPLAGYQAFLRQVWGGALARMLAAIHQYTLGTLSLILILTISYSYGQRRAERFKAVLPAVSLAAYCIFAGGSQGVFASSWLFTALVVSIAASALFVWLARLQEQSGVWMGETQSTAFSVLLSALMPASVVLIAAAVLREGMVFCLGETNFQQIISNLIFYLFRGLGQSLLSALFFMLTLHLLWFFGVHGGNVLDGVANTLFSQPAAGLLAAGEAAPIYTKTFLDTMALFGGCGSLLCLLAAILLCDRRRNIRSLAKLSALPALFNINEIAMFGLPVVANPILLIPFIGVPVALTLVSALAMRLGWVPVCTVEVNWTIPILWSGYLATGSLRGSLLQLFNLMLGTAIYIPFLRLSQKHQVRTFKQAVGEMGKLVKEAEEEGVEPQLMARKDRLGAAARELAGELRQAMREGGLRLHYQPQVDEQGRMQGAEALLRWKRDGETLYPPLVIALAQEAGLLVQLGDWIMDQVCEDMQALGRQGAALHVAVNVSAHQLSDPKFLQKLLERLRRYDFGACRLTLEITEQTALSASNRVFGWFKQLQGLGVSISMDDFGMGHASMMYLQDNHFNEVKLDGSLVRGMMDNPRSADIIRSIVYLSHTLDFTLLAEYVETPEERDRLLELGCTLYQGYLFSPALPLDKMIAYWREHR